MSDNTMLYIAVVMYEDDSMDFFPATSIPEAERLVSEASIVYDGVESWQIAQYPLDADLYKLNQEQREYH